MKFTIITPSLNQGQYLEDTIRSILSQEYPELEYLVIDGGSTDNTREILQRYNNRIDYWVSEPDRGQSHAINKGLVRATGDIVTWINSDDQLLPGALHKAASYFSRYPDVFLIHGKSRIKSASNEIIKGSPDDDLDARYLAGLPYPQPASFFRRSVIDETGPLDEDLHFGMDYDLLVRTFLNHDVLRVDEVFSLYLLHDTSKSTQQNAAFARDWSLVFSKVLRSAETPALPYIEEMRRLGLYRESSGQYGCSRLLTPDLLHRAFGYFLVNQVIFYFQDGRYAKARQLMGALRRDYKDLYDREALSKSHWLSKPVINLLDKIRRSF